MILEELIVAGFGGQGVLSMGMTLAYAGMVEGREVSWMPSYGPEMRGGTANCITILSEKRISSPIIARFSSAIVLNQPSMEKFAPRVKAGGLLLYESSMVMQPTDRSDIDLVPIAAIEAAREFNNPKIMNMIVLGAFLQLKPVVPIPSILDALKEVLPEKYHHLIPLNEMALRKGASMVAHAPVF